MMKSNGDEDAGAAVAFILAEKQNEEMKNALWLFATRSAFCTPITTGIILQRAMSRQMYLLPEFEVQRIGKHKSCPVSTKRIR